MVKENMKKRKLYAVLVFAALLMVPAFNVFSQVRDFSCTPLLDTPSNRIYLEKLLEDIEQAKESIKVVMNTIDYYPQYPNGPQRELLRSLKEAEKRGVEVKILMDESKWSKEITEGNKKAAKFMRQFDVSVKFESPKTTTHSKLVIIDGKVIYLGSSNWNYSTYEKTFQSNVRIESPQIAEVWIEYFNCLWTEKEMTVENPAPKNFATKAVLPILNTGNSRSYLNIVTGAIEKAKSSIRIAMYRAGYYPKFEKSPSNVLLEKLASARERGVQVRVILDKSDWSDKTNQINKKAAWWMKLNGIRVKFDPSGVDTHVKLIIIDSKHLVIGSTNWTYFSLAENNETDLLITNMPRITGVYVQYFQHLWEKSHSPTQ